MHAARRPPLERGVWGVMPYAAVGSGGPPVVLLAGLGPTTGVGSDSAVRHTLAPVAALATRRRLVAMNRRHDLPRGMTMADLAAEHAEALRTGPGTPVDLVGVSTGGSIAQQVAADHPDVVRRLVLASTGSTLPPPTRAMQAGVAQLVRQGRDADAVALLATDLLPGRLHPVGQVLGRLVAARLRDPQGLADLATTVEAEDGFDLAGRPTLQCPTLVVGGTRDRFYPPVSFVRTAALVPGARLELFAGRGHVTVLADREARAAICRFLDG